MIFNPYVPQMQNSFIPVRSETEAINYPVAFGHSVAFKNITEPYMYTKTMGFSPTDKPVLERYRREDEEEIGLKDEISALWMEIDSLKKKGTNDEHTKSRKSVQAKSDNGDAAEA